MLNFLLHGLHLSNKLLLSFMDDNVLSIELSKAKSIGMGSIVRGFMIPGIWRARKGAGGEGQWCTRRCAQEGREQFAGTYQPSHHLDGRSGELAQLGEHRAGRLVPAVSRLGPRRGSGPAAGHGPL